MCLVMFGPFAHDLRPSAVFDWFSPRLAEVLRTTVECAAAARGFTGRSPFKADGLHYSFIIVSVYRAWKWRLKIAGICRNMKLHETVIYVLVYIYCYIALYTEKSGHIEVSSDSTGSSRGWKGSDHVQMLKVLQVTFSLKGCVVSPVRSVYLCMS